MYMKFIKNTGYDYWKINFLAMIKIRLKSET